MLTATQTDAARRRGIDPVAQWLFVICAMIFFMVVLGGVTRLTQSGLSMVDWRPVTGWLPPLSETEWRSVFEAYRTSPEYREINAGMSLDDFKGIFWLEYLHRLFGRIIGLAFFLPFVFFWLTGRMAPALRLKCLAMFVLGGLQGVLGWYMVKSGLVDQPDVSQYRLAAHLGLALVIYLYVLWTALGIVQPRLPASSGGWPAHSSAALGLLALIGLTALSGAFVAGLDAGLMYNTFPLMDGQIIPDDLLELSPWYVNFFENRTTVQFDHRVLALISLAATLFFRWRLARRAAPRAVVGAANLLVLAVLLQAALGVATLLTAVPVALGALHQAGAVLLLTAALWLVHQTARGGADHTSASTADGTS